MICTDFTAAIAEATRYVTHARDRDGGRPVLEHPTWTLLEGGEGRFIRVIASDAFRLAYCDVPFDGEAPAIELAATLSTLAVFPAEQAARTARGYSSTATVERAALLAALPSAREQKRRDEYPSVHVSLGRSHVHVAGHVADSRATSAPACKVDHEEWSRIPRLGKPMTATPKHATLATKFLTDALKALPHDAVRLTITHRRNRTPGTGASEPVIVEGAVPTEGAKVPRGDRECWVRELRYREYVMPIWTYHPLDVEEAEA